MRQTIDFVLANSPAQQLFIKRRPTRLAVLAYHGIDDAERFEQQLDLLAGVASPISLDQLLDAASDGDPLPPNPVLITFDDGERSLLEAGVPLLRARGLPAVAFVVAGLLDSEEPFWWVEVDRRARAGGTVSGQHVSSPEGLIRRLKQVPDAERCATIEELRDSTPGLTVSIPQLRRSELRSLETSGVVVGNHSLSHRCLAQCTRHVIEREIIEAHAILTDALGHPPRSFVYPDGSFDGRVRKVLASAGYDAAFLFDHRISELPVTDLLRISRVRVNSRINLDRFKIILSGLHPAIHHLIGRT